MKLIFIVILISFSTVSFAQKTFSGTYFTTKKDIGFESDIFQFRKDGSFIYILFTCTGTGIGKGKYQIIDNYLNLEFLDCKDCNEINQVKYINNEDDSTEINLTVKSWYDKEAILGASAVFPIEKSGAISDKNGKIQFKTKKSETVRNLKIQFIGYDPIILRVNPNCSIVDGTVYFSNTWIYSSSEYKKFKIVNWKKSKFKLERYPDFNITYDKIKSNKIDELIEKRLGEIEYNFFKEKMSI